MRSSLPAAEKDAICPRSFDYQNFLYTRKNINEKSVQYNCKHFRSSKCGAKLKFPRDRAGVVDFRSKIVEGKHTRKCCVRNDVDPDDYDWDGKPPAGAGAGVVGPGDGVEELTRQHYKGTNNDVPSSDNVEDEMTGILMEIHSCSSPQLRDNEENAAGDPAKRYSPRQSNISVRLPQHHDTENEKRLQFRVKQLESQLAQQRLQTRVRELECELAKQKAIEKRLREEIPSADSMQNRATADAAVTLSSMNMQAALRPSLGTSAYRPSLQSAELAQAHSRDIRPDAQSRRPIQPHAAVSNHHPSPRPCNLSAADGPEFHPSKKSRHV